VANDVRARADRHLLRFGCDFARFVPVRASGCYLYDASGTRMLDFTSGQMSAILGHSHPEIVATIRHASGTLDHLYSAMVSEPVVGLAEELAKQAPELSKVMLLSTGGEANEAAIKLAKTVTGKWEIACSQLCGLGHYRMRGEYHVVDQSKWDQWQGEELARLR